MRKVYKQIILFSICLLIVSSLILIIFFIFINLPGPLKERKLFIVEKGATHKIVAKRLFDANIINSYKIFNMLHLIQKKLFNPQIKSGEYEFLQNTTLLEVTKKLYSGKSFQRKFTIPEGYTVKQIIDFLYKIPYLSGKILQNDISEGSLFPSTYFYSYGTSRQTIIEQMQHQINLALSEAEQHIKSKSYPIKNKEDILIFASIIEKESKYDSDKPKIASVLLNRLRLKMKLQVDATVVYALSNGIYADFNRRVSYEDIKITSPYNTYRIYGLPIGPICCPGAKAIEAAVLNEPSDFLYFLAKNDGTIVYSKTLREHNIEKLKKKSGTNNNSTLYENKSCDAN